MKCDIKTGKMRCRIIASGSGANVTITIFSDFRQFCHLFENQCFDQFINIPKVFWVKRKFFDTIFELKYFYYNNIGLLISTSLTIFHYLTLILNPLSRIFHIKYKAKPYFEKG
jgi:hypothetical protein